MVWGVWCGVCGVGCVVCGVARELTVGVDVGVDGVIVLCCESVLWALLCSLAVLCRCIGQPSHGPQSPSHDAHRSRYEPQTSSCEICRAPPGPRPPLRRTCSALAPQAPMHRSSVQLYHCRSRLPIGRQRSCKLLPFDHPQKVLGRHHSNLPTGRSFDLFGECLARGWAWADCYEGSGFRKSAG